jgi:hypothetical protein
VKTPRYANSQHSSFSSCHPFPGGAVGVSRHSCSRATAYSRSIRSALHRQVELLALHDLRPVDVEEVGVEDGLDEASDHGNWVEVALHCVPAD